MTFNEIHLISSDVVHGMICLLIKVGRIKMKKKYCYQTSSKLGLLLIHCTLSFDLTCWFVACTRWLFLSNHSSFSLYVLHCLHCSLFLVPLPTLLLACWISHSCSYSLLLLPVSFALSLSYFSFILFLLFSISSTYALSCSFTKKKIVVRRVLLSYIDGWLFLTHTALLYKLPFGSLIQYVCADKKLT